MRKDWEFAVGDFLFVKTSSIRGVVRFSRAGKLTPRYVGPFRVLNRIGLFSYRVEFPERFLGSIMLSICPI